METYRYLQLRYRPSPDIGEFINIGILLVCESLGYIAYRLQNEKDVRRRLKSLAPNFDASFLKSELEYIENSLRSKRDALSPDEMLAFYVKIQEGIFFCGEPGSVFWDGKPDELLHDLFHRFLCGGSGQRESEESRLVSQIRKLMADKPWKKLYRKQEYRNSFGYEISLPFVSDSKATKPMCLTDGTYTTVKDKTLIWMERFKMFRDLMPELVIVPYKLSEDAALRNLGLVFLGEMENHLEITPVDVSGGIVQLMDRMAPAI